MPKAILEFSLPEEQEEFDAAVNGTRVNLCLFDFDQWLRSKIKYGDDSSCSNLDTMQEVRDQLYEFLGKYNIQI